MAEQAPNSEDIVQITFSHRGTPHTLDFPSQSTITDLSTRIESHFSIPAAKQKFMITPKLGLLRPPFADPLPLSMLNSKKIVLLAPTPAELSSLARPRSSPLPTHSNIKPVAPSRYRDWQKSQEEAAYTFHSILPLSYLPNPARSRIFLERLRDDPGIKASMRKHKFSVGVLTEMNPADHTTHESRTLGLNRNRGEVIELRLRTDAYDGYRDYKIIRDTLCHELAHNVFGDHDRNFWDLCKSIEKEVREADWKHGGQAVSKEIFYDPKEREESGGHVDGGGWSGGDFMLGGSSGKERGPSQMQNRRELMAKAAEERMRRQREAESGGSGASA